MSAQVGAGEVTIGEATGAVIGVTRITDIIRQFIRRGTTTTIVIIRGIAHRIITAMTDIRIITVQEIRGQTVADIPTEIHLLLQEIIVRLATVMNLDTELLLREHLTDIAQEMRIEQIPLLQGQRQLHLREETGLILHVRQEQQQENLP